MLTPSAKVVLACFTGILIPLRWYLEPRGSLTFSSSDYFLGLLN